MFYCLSGVRLNWPPGSSVSASIELRCQQELRRNDRQAVYLHLAAHLPCGTQTLIKRAKQLVLDEEKTVIRRPLNRSAQHSEPVQLTLHRTGREGPFEAVQLVEACGGGGCATGQVTGSERGDPRDGSAGAGSHGP